MSTRLVQIVLPADTDVDELLGDSSVLSSWSSDEGEDRVLHVVVVASDVEGLLDRVEDALGDEGRVTVLAVEAHRPVLDPEEPAVEDEKRFGRVSRDELRGDLGEGAEGSPAFFALVALSAVVCAVGLLRDDVAVLIAGMVIAPLLGPNIALALATALADGPLARQALVTNAFGLISAFSLAFAAGLLLPIDLDTAELVARSRVDLADVLLALAAGAAGTLSYTTDRAGAVIGVMVAVALVPPLVASGLFAGAGDTRAASAAMLLTCVNVTCVNLAAVATFLLQGVRPRRWWEAERAKRASRWALAAWLILLLALIALLTLGRSWVNA